MMNDLMEIEQEMQQNDQEFMNARWLCLVRGRDPEALELGGSSAIGSADEWKQACLTKRNAVLGAEQF